MINLDVLQGNEDAIARALELYDNHTKRIRMQRRAMDAKDRAEMIEVITESPQQFKPGDLVVHESRTTEPFDVPLTLPDGSKIGTATVHYKDGVLYVDGVFTDGSGAQMLGIDLTLETLYTPVDDVVSLVAEPAGNETTDITNTEPDH